MISKTLPQSPRRLYRSGQRTPAPRNVVLCGRLAYNAQSVPPAVSACHGRSMNFNLHDLVLLMPEDFLLGAICVILFVDLFLKSPQRIVTHWLSLIAVVATIGILLVDHDAQKTAFNGAYIHDGVAAVLKVFIL